MIANLTVPAFGPAALMALKGITIRTICPRKVESGSPSASLKPQEYKRFCERYT